MARYRVGVVRTIVRSVEVEAEEEEQALEKAEELGTGPGGVGS